jgi:uncharacterized membrane protein YqiK
VLANLVKKPTIIAGLVLLALLGLQTWRLVGVQQDLAQAVLEKATIVAEIATARAEGVAEGARQQKAAQEEKDRRHAEIVAGLEKDKAQLQKSYDNTYSMLRDFAGRERQCLLEPLPEKVLENFRR